MWRRLTINKQNIIAETGKAVRIACPHKSDFDGYSFWHPAKLVRDGSYLNTVSISYTEEFVFRLKKYGKGKYNSREVLDEVQFAYDEIEEVFQCMDAGDDFSEPVIYTPEPLEPEHATADESLIDNG